jgi:hypothetical protein
MADIDVKAILADGEIFYRNGANVDGYSVDGLATAMVAGAVIGTAATLAFDTDDTMAADSDTRVPTQAAVVAYVAANGGGVGNISDTDTDVTGWDFVLDEDDMASDSATKLPTQQSVKAYVDSLPTLTTSDTGKVPISTVSGVTTLDVSNLAETGGAGYIDSSFTIENALDATKLLAFDCATITTGTTRTMTIPDDDGTIMLNTSSEEVEGIKTFVNGFRTLTNPFFAIGLNGTNTNTRSNPLEVFGTTAYPARIAFLHDSSGDVDIHDSYAQTVISASICEIVARGHTGSPTTQAGFASGNQLRILGITTEAVQNTSRGAYWQFYTTATAGSSNRAVFRIFETGAFGYPDAAGSGVGGTVTQATSKSTGVTLNTPTGQITMNNAALAATTTVGFTLTNSCIESTDTVLVNLSSGGTTNSYYVGVDAVASGSCHFIVRNFTAGSLGEALVINYTLIKGANA